MASMGMGAAPPAAAPPAAAPATGGGSGPLAALRAHPQFAQLRQLVQTNPAALQSVLAQIGQQSPELLQQIHANQDEFIRMMNEPVSATPAPAAPPAAGGGAVPGLFGAPGGAPGGQPGPEGMGGMGGLNPAQLAQMIAGLPPAQRANLARATGMTPEQFEQMSRMIGSMPPEQFEQMMQMMGGPGGMGGGGGGPPPGANVVRLSPDDAAAVGRLTELGFGRDDVVQAYLACDKNEALAANLLMDGSFESSGMGGGGGFGAPAPTPAPAPADAPAPAPSDAPGPAPGAEDDDDMYS